MYTAIVHNIRAKGKRHPPRFFASNLIFSYLYARKSTNHKISTQKKAVLRDKNTFVIHLLYLLQRYIFLFFNLANKRIKHYLTRKNNAGRHSLSCILSKKEPTQRTNMSTKDHKYPVSKEAIKGISPPHLHLAPNRTYRKPSRKL